MTPRTRAAIRRCLSSPRVVVGIVLIAAITLVALFAPWLAPHDPQDQDLLNTLVPPAWSAGGLAEYPLGTDSLGRCVLSRVLYGARIALYVAILAATGAMILGTILALVAGYFGGWVDWAISRLVDIWMAFPPVILALILLVGLGAGVNKVILAIVLIDWTRFCRVVRTETMGQAQMDYVVAARTIGFARPAILFREILPNVAPVLIALLTLEMGIAVVVEAILSFVGLSVSSDTPTWGGMIAEGRQIVHEAWWVLAAPLAALFATVVAFNQLGDGLARSLDPVLRR